MAYGRGWRAVYPDRWRWQFDAMKQRISTKRGGKKNQLKLHRNLWAYYHPSDDTIVIRLHVTDILIYRNDGTCTVYGARWNSGLTRYWLFEGTSVRIWRKRFNRWTPALYMFGNDSLFFDGLLVKDGVVQNPKTVTVMQPTPEAKELRKKLSTLGRTYKQMVKMGEASHPHPTFLARSGVDDAHLHVIDCALNSNHEVNAHTLDCLCCYGGGWTGVLALLDRMYFDYVRKHNLLTPKEQ